MALIIFQPFAPFGSKEASSLKGNKRLHPLANGFRGLIVEQPIKHVTVALPGGPTVPEPLGNVLP